MRCRRLWACRRHWIRLRATASVRQKSDGGYKINGLIEIFPVSALVTPTAPGLSLPRQTMSLALLTCSPMCPRLAGQGCLVAQICGWKLQIIRRLGLAEPSSPCRPSHQAGKDRTYVSSAPTPVAHWWNTWCATAAGAARTNPSPADGAGYHGVTRMKAHRHGLYPHRDAIIDRRAREQAGPSSQARSTPSCRHNR
jgi:hypothetical protein